MKYFSLAIAVLAAACTQVASQELPPLFSDPVLLWQSQLTADVNLGPTDILKGNGVFMAPDGTTAYVTTVGATVYAFDAYSGAALWTYQPETVGTSITRSHSGLSFGPTADYMVYSVVDNENSLNPETRVIALDFSGAELWISDPLEGVPSGEPLISSDGSYVFVVHNANDLTNGYFTILDAKATGLVFYSEPSGGDGNSTAAFGPPGIYHTPIQGNYDPIEGGMVSEGDFNTNDMIMWSQTPKPTDVTVQNGFIYGFQFPRDFDAGNASSSVGFFQMGDFVRDFQSITPPVMTNGGLSAYWGVSRSAFHGWTPKRFSRARSAAVGFTRLQGSPGQACWAAPALSSSEDQPFIFGGTASAEFIRLNFDMTESVEITTSALIKSKAIVDGEDRAVYYVETNGNLHQADFNSLADLWNFTINFSVEGEMAMTPNSAVIIVADTRGVIQALQVADIPATESPSAFPSDVPSMTPTSTPTISLAPIAGTLSPTSTPTGNETEFPTPGPSSTEPPVVAPVAPDAPVAPPTSEGGTTPTTEEPASTPAPAAVAEPPSAGTRPMTVIALLAAFACLLY